MYFCVKNSIEHGIQYTNLLLQISCNIVNFIQLIYIVVNINFAISTQTWNHGFSWDVNFHIVWCGRAHIPVLALPVTGWVPVKIMVRIVRKHDLHHWINLIKDNMIGHTNEIHQINFLLKCNSWVSMRLKVIGCPNLFFGLVCFLVFSS